MRGLKDHEIAILVNDVTFALANRWELPQMLRELVSSAVIRSLEKQHARIDGGERICLDCGLRRGGDNVAADF